MVASSAYAQAGSFVLVAVPLGLMMALNRYVNAIVKPLFDLLKPMPPLAWISIAILWFGIGERTLAVEAYVFSAPPPGERAGRHGHRPDRPRGLAVGE